MLSFNYQIILENTGSQMLFVGMDNAFKIHKSKKQESLKYFVSVNIRREM